MMENFALIALVRDLETLAVGMRVRRVAQYSGRLLSFETRSGKMPGLRLSLDPRTPSLRVPATTTDQAAITDDFVMVLRKHLVSARLVGIRKPLAERIVELRFRTALPATELREVTLVAELIPNAPNLLLLDASRHILATFSPPAKNRPMAQYEEYSYPQNRKLPLETALGEDTTWFDDEAFRTEPVRWLVDHLAGTGPVFATEMAARAPAWAHMAGGVAAGIRNQLLALQQPAQTAFVYTDRPLSVIIDRGDAEGLRGAVISPFELESLRNRSSYQSFPGMMAALQAVADPLETALLLDRARLPELRRLKRELNKVGIQRARLQERRRRFEEASAGQATAQLLVSSGAEMDRHHTSVQVTEYTAEGSKTRSVPLDGTKTLRENVERMFRKQQKAGRGLGIVDRQLARLDDDETRLQLQEKRLRNITHWDAWLAASQGGHRRQKQPSKPRVQRGPRRRPVSLDGRDVFIGRNSRENDELTFRVAASEDFWLHVADYSGSHVIVRNPSGDTELDEPLLVRAAQLAAYHSQARNAAKVEVHYTQRKFVGKPRKAPPGLVRLREFKTIAVEPRDWTREERSPVSGQLSANDTDPKPSAAEG